MYLQFSIEGEKQLSRNLTTLDANLKNWKNEFSDVGRYLKNFFSGEVFESRGAVIGEGWKALNPAYAAWKAKHFPGRGILERTGKMRKSFQAESGNDYTRVFNNTDYFKYHQSRMPRAVLPRRVMMKLDEKRKQTIIQIFRQGLQTQINRSGFKSLGI